MSPRLDTRRVMILCGHGCPCGAAPDEPCNAPPLLTERDLDAHEAERLPVRTIAAPMAREDRIVMPACIAALSILGALAMSGLLPGGAV